SGVPYVAYQDSTKEGKATVQRFNGNAWEVVGNAGFSGGQALFTDLAMDQNGNLYVAYASPNAFVKKFVPAALADQVVPTITCPTDIVQDAGPQCFISVTLTDPIASDN
ncbi:hypothetical protein MWU78_22310, partial [Arenibacter sp. F26102]|uniref:hypothetical protein n=1 Tax=Arenibacter sp. F26102 TaxID=2926416 RepID=UPI001FF26244